MPASKSYLAGEPGTPERVRCFRHPKSSVFYLEYRVAGAKVRESTGTRDEAAAKSAADRKVAALREAPPTERPSRSIPQVGGLPTFGQLAEKWLWVLEQDSAGRELPVTPSYLAAVARAVRYLKAHIGADTLASSLRLDHLRQYIVERKRRGVLARGRAGQPVGFATLRDEIQTAKAITRWAVGDRHLPADPWAAFTFSAKTARYAPEQVILEPAECACILAACEQFPARDRLKVRTLVVLVYETARRVGAVRLLRWSDVDLEAGTIVWRRETDKKRRGGKTPITAEALEALRAWRATSRAIGDAWVFPGLHDATQPLPDGTAEEWWRKLERFAKLPRRRQQGWHSLRRRGATDLLDAQPAVAGELLGHSPAMLTGTYQKPSLEDMREALRSRRRHA